MENLFFCAVVIASDISIIYKVQNQNNQQSSFQISQKLKIIDSHKHPIIWNQN